MRSTLKRAHQFLSEMMYGGGKRYKVRGSQGTERVSRGEALRRRFPTHDHYGVEVMGMDDYADAVAQNKRLPRRQRAAAKRVAKSSERRFMKGSPKVPR